MSTFSMHVETVQQKQFLTPKQKRLSDLLWIQGKSDDDGLITRTTHESHDTNDEDA